MYKVDIKLFLSNSTIESMPDGNFSVLHKIIGYSIDSSMLREWDFYSEYIDFFKEISHWLTKEGKKLQEKPSKDAIYEHIQRINKSIITGESPEKKPYESVNAGKKSDREIAEEHYKALKIERRKTRLRNTVIGFFHRLGFTVKDYGKEGAEVTKWELPRSLKIDISFIELFLMIVAAEIEFGDSDFNGYNPEITFLSDKEPSHNTQKIFVNLKNSRTKSKKYLHLVHKYRDFMTQERSERIENRLNIFSPHIPRDFYILKEYYRLQDELEEFKKDKTSW